MTDALRDRHRGCVVGQCLGDALGFPLEGFPPADCLAYVEEVLGAGDAGQVARPGFSFGQYTDDSQLLRTLLESFDALGRFDADDVAGRFARLVAEGRLVGGGRATLAAARRLGRGVPWALAGTPAPSAGNGSAMRAAAIGLMFPGDLPRLIDAAATQSRITHQDPRCAAGSIAIAAGAALALRPGPLDPGRFCDLLAGYCAPHDPLLAGALGHMPGWIPLHPPDAFDRIAGVGREPGGGDPWHGVSPFVTGSVLWSLYAFLRSPDDWWQVIQCAIAAGGDVDSTAAMAGALSGARVGFRRLPGDLARRLHDRDGGGLDELVALADRVCARAVAAS